MLWLNPQAVHRTASMSAPQAPQEPLETVTLNRMAGSQSSPTTEVLAQAGARVAAQTAANLDMSKGALTQLMTELQEQGVGFRHRGRFLFWLGDLKDSKPEKAAALVAKEKAGRVVANHPDLRVRMGINNAKDLFEVDAFYGSGNHFRTDNPGLSKNIADLSKAGVSFIDRNVSYAENLGPFWAYNVLEDGQPVYFKKGDDRGAVENPDEAALLAYLFDVGDATGTQAPELAKSLKFLWREGVLVDGEKPWKVYDNLLKAKPEETLTLKFGANLGEVRRDELDDSQAMLKKFMPWKQLYQSLGSDSHAYEWYHQVASDRSQSDRVALLKGLRKADLGKSQYETILDVAGERGDLSLALDLGVKVRETRADWEKSYRAASALDAGHQGDFLRGLGLSRDYQSGEAFWKVFGGDGQERALAFARVEEVKDWFRDESTALQAVTVMGAKPDLELMKMLAEGTDIAVPLYPMGLGLKKASQEALAEVGRVGRQAELVQKLWPSIAAAGESRIPERTEAWKGLAQEISHDGPTRATQIFQELAENYSPELLPRMAELYRLNLEGSGGRTKEAADNWEKLSEFESPELVTHMFAVTRNFERAGRLVKLAASDLPSVPLQERVESLALVARHDPQPEKAYRFLVSQHQPGESLKSRAGLYARAREVYSEEGEARAVVGAYENSPHHGSPAAAERLGELLRLGGELHRVRDLWHEVEARTPEQRAADLETLRTLNQAKKRRTQSSLAIFKALMQYPATGGAQALAKIDHLQQLDGEKLELFLDRLVRTDVTAERRALELEGFAEVQETVGMDSALEGWENLRSRVGSAELKEHAQLLKSLRDAEFYNQVVASRQEGEKLEDLGALAAWAHTEGYSSWRHYLEKGSPEGNDLVENTAFMADLIRSKDDPRKLIREAFAPLGNESTAQRRESLLKLREKMGNVDQTVAAWNSITLHSPPGTADFSEATEVFPEMQKTLGDKALGFMDLVRQEQQRGASMTLTTALAAVAPSALEKRLSLAQLKEILLERGDTGVEIDEETVTVGDFTVAVNH